MIDMVCPAATNSAIAVVFIVEAKVHSSGAIPKLTRVPTPPTTPTQKRSKPNGMIPILSLLKSTTKNQVS
jgi:hypothetical protein